MMAKKYKKKLPHAVITQRLQPLQTSALPFENEALYANWKWFKFEKSWWNKLTQKHEIIHWQKHTIERTWHCMDHPGPRFWKKTWRASDGKAFDAVIVLLMSCFGVHYIKSTSHKLWWNRSKCNSLFILFFFSPSNLSFLFYLKFSSMTFFLVLRLVILW